jgi:hypothetical protein
VGLATLALTLTGSVLLVLDVATDDEIAIPVASAVGVVLLALWFVLPLRLLRQPRENLGSLADGRPDEKPTPART